LKKINFEKTIITISITISTLLLLLFGAYETSRLYLHMILIGWLIIFAYGEDFTTSKIGVTISKIGNSFYTYAIVGLLFIFWSISTFNYRLSIIEPVNNILDGREVQANWVIGKDGAKQYRDIIESNMGLWAVDSHVWGIYYGIDNFYRGENLSTTNIDSIAYVIVNNNIGWIYSNDDSIKRLQDFCTKSVEKVITADNLYKQTLYKISPVIIDSCIKKQK